MFDSCNPVAQAADTNWEIKQWHFFFGTGETYSDETNLVPFKNKGRCSHAIILASKHVFGEGGENVF